MSTDRRRFSDTQQPRATYAQGTVKDNCRLVRTNSLPYVALLALGFEELCSEGDCALLKAPADFVVAQERC